MKTTLNKIYAASPCDRGWNAILNYVGKIDYDQPISMNTVLDAVGLFGAIWCLRTLDNCDEQKRAFDKFCNTGASIDEIRLKFFELFGD